MEWMLYVAFMIAVGGEKCPAPIRLHRLCTELRNEADDVEPSGWADRTGSKGTASRPPSKTSNVRWVVTGQTEDETESGMAPEGHFYVSLELPAL